MGDKKKKKNNSDIFYFAPSKKPKEIAVYLSGLLKQNKMSDRCDGNIQNTNKRALRSALNNQDISKLKKIFGETANVNLVIDDVFWDTPLSFAVKHAYLEVVEMLLASPDCDIDCLDRNNHTALDEAIKAWLIGGIMVNKQQRGRRFRILRCLITSGGKRISASFLDSVIYSCQNTRTGLASIEKLVKLASQRGHAKMKTTLLSVLISHVKMASFIRCLLQSGADPSCLIHPSLSCHSLPEDNAVAIIKATNSFKVLNRVEQCLGIPRDLHQHRRCPRIQLLCSNPHRKYTEAVKLLILSGYTLHLQTMMYLHSNHATLYKTALYGIRQPQPLKNIARIVVREKLQPNVMAAIPYLTSIPEQLKPFLIFEEI